MAHSQSLQNQAPRVVASHSQTTSVSAVRRPVSQQTRSAVAALDPRLAGIGRVIVCLTLALMALIGVALAPTPAHAAADTSETSNQDVALKIADTLDSAIDALDGSDYESAYREVQNAYFKYYDPLLEGPSMSLSGNRKPMMEGLFGKAKSQAKAKDSAAARSTIESIKLNAARDALELDGVIADDLPEDQKEAAAQKLLDQRSTTAVTPEARRVYSFVTAFTILLREGLEALLVVAAIVLYLVRSGNRQLTKYVYWGVLAGIGVSILLAVLLSAVFQNAGAGQEMLEGGTMFLAVLVLFYISNWMLSKSDEQAWERYVQDKVDRSITTGSMWLLSFAAFLAVTREGAELVLFYAAAFQGGMADSLWIGIGIAAAAALLIAVFIIFRYFAVKLPIGIVFKATSALLFLLAIVFVGNGVVELGEAGFILGQASIPSLSWLTVPVLGLYPRAETLLPQVILVIAAVWLTIAQNRELRREKRELAEAEAVAAEAGAEAEAALIAAETTD